MQNTGVIELASGAIWRARDNLCYTDAAGNTTAALILDAGSTLIFDSSQAISPATTRYRYGSCGGSTLSYRPFQANGTPGSHVTVTSCAAGNETYCVGGTANSALPGQFRASKVGATGCANSGCGYMQVTYTDFSYIGDATTYGQAFEIGFYTTATTFTFTHNTCNRCGPGLNAGTGALSAGSTLHVDYNVWTNSVGTGSNIFLNAATTLTSGARTVTYNVFDKRWNDADGNCNGEVLMYNTAFTGNYYGGGKCASGEPNVTADANPSTNEFFYLPSTQSQSIFAVGGSLSGGYYFSDYPGSPGEEMKPFYMENPLWTLSGSVIETADDQSGNVGHAVPTWNGATDYFQNNIALPSKTGTGTINIGVSTNTCGTACSTIWFYHNTVAGPTSQGLIHSNEAGSVTAAYPALESNLAFAPGGTGYCKVSTGTGTGTLFQNDVTVADYNAADSHLISSAASTGCLATCPNSVCVNQGNGYIGNWSATPGAHDVTGSPNFADPLRNVALWDTKYLGRAAGTAWQTGAAYTVGQIVSDSHAGYYGGLPINFRCIAAHTSGSATEPNVGANWRNDWEWASLNDLRTAVPAGETYNTDGAIGCASGCSATKALVNWVRVGYTPQNPALWCAGHDGEAIGAVPFCAAGKVMIGILAGM